MTNAKRLKEIEGQLEFGPSQENIIWMFNRVKRLTEALEDVKSSSWGPIDTFCYKKISKALEEE